MLCAYLELAFWLMPQIRRSERRPLPACLVSKIRALFPATDNEEEFADYVFNGFCYGDEETWRLWLRILDQLYIVGGTHFYCIINLLFYFFSG